MKTTRLEAFSDGVIAILITIMVLELKVPHYADMDALLELAPVLLSYLLSYVFVGIYWNNHHHLLHLVHHVSGRILWANLHLLFWLSLVPFATSWMGEHPSDPLPTAAYGLVLLACGVAWLLLQTAIIHDQGPSSPLKDAVGRDWKGKVSAALYTTAFLAAWVSPHIAQAIFVVVSAIWFVPDRRIEKKANGAE
jgi:uncharacterized membrane protein